MIQIHFLYFCLFSNIWFCFFILSEGKHSWWEYILINNFTSDCKQLLLGPFPVWFIHFQVSPWAKHNPQHQDHDASQSAEKGILVLQSRNDKRHMGSFICRILPQPLVTFALKTTKLVEMCSDWRTLASSDQTFCQSLVERFHAAETHQYH